MQPIPYAPVAGSDPLSIILKIALGLAIFAAAGIFYTVLKKRNNGKIEMFDEFLTMGGMILGCLFIALGFAPAVHITPDRSQIDEQTESVQKELKSTYGVKLSQEEAEGLKYPTEDPKDKFNVFGSFEDQKQVEGKSFKSRTVYLVWSDGSLGLSESSDGKSFTPLEPRA